LIPRTVTIGLSVLTAVDLDHQLCLSACEVDDVGADRQLSSELRSVARKQFPDLAFFGGCVRPQRAGAFSGFDFYASRHLSAVAKRALRTHP
jgi:hypothetical protein